MDTTESSPSKIIMFCDATQHPAHTHTHTHASTHTDTHRQTYTLTHTYKHTHKPDKIKTKCIIPDPRGEKVKPAIWLGLLQSLERQTTCAMSPSPSRLSSSEGRLC